MGYPRYSELDELGLPGHRRAWSVLPPHEGALAKTTPEHVAAAAHGVTAGVTVPLNLPVDAFDPPLFGRAPLQHRVVEATRNDAEDVLDSLNPQASSQLDGLAHVRAREHGYFGGHTELAAARDTVGMHHWAERGIAARGVLLDLAATTPDAFAGHGFRPDELTAVAEKQQVEFREGDVLLVRTGWVGEYLRRPPAERGDLTHWNGLHAGETTAEFLWNAGFALVGADNPAVENGPGSAEAGSLHRRMLPALGVSFLELLALDRLAAECAARGRWDFLFVSVPLNVRGAVSSTANAMAIL